MAAGGSSRATHSRRRTFRLSSINCKSNCHPNRRRASEPPKPLYRLQLSPHCGEDLLVARTNFQPLALCKTCEVRKTGQQRLDHGLVAEEALPLVIDEV